MDTIRADRVEKGWTVQFDGVPCEVLTVTKVGAKVEFTIKPLDKDASMGEFFAECPAFQLLQCTPK